MGSTWVGDYLRMTSLDMVSKLVPMFTGNRLVSWFIDSDECKTRQDGVNLGRRLLENDIIRHGE